MRTLVWPDGVFKVGVQELRALDGARHERMAGTYGPCRVRLVWGNANFGGAMPTGGDLVPDGYEQALTKLVAAEVTDIDTARYVRASRTRHSWP